MTTDVIAYASGRDVGFKYRGKVALVACIKCGTRRWVQAARIPPTGLCISCSGKRTVRLAIAGNTGRPRPDQSERQRGHRNPSWNGGITRGGNGYRYALVLPDDPFYPMANKEGYAMEHRLVVAKQIGRLLEPWEQVHHKNGNRVDNRPENLELWHHSHPSGVRHGDYHCPGCRCFDAGHRKD